MRLRLRDRSLDLRAGAPTLMGIVNATPDSFSDDQAPKPLDALVERGRALARAGAALVDVGGESGRTDRPPVSVDEEASRIVPVVERLSAEGIAVSVDTWRAAVAHAAVEAGAVLINDVSGLSDPDVAAACAGSGAGLVVTHTRVAPKAKGFPEYSDVVDDVVGLLAERAAAARERGVGKEQLLLDPGLDLAKTPAESVELLRRLPELERLGRPLLLAISRKDFVGALTGRPPRERDAGTLGAIEPALDCAVGTVLRVHDVGGAADFLAVRAALRGVADAPTTPLDDSLRRESAPA
ncbi:MAG TPA: dihydropteroate synthase [Thermoleophilaceae bacterium]|nr:dihydropteroate synthase [Thermoleophilaceae bacterium]